MYLYYYCNEKFVGQVDIEVFMSFQQKKSLITCDQAGEDLVSALELMYGKRIEHVSLKEAVKIHTHKFNYKGHNTYIPPHVFLTKKRGKQLDWDALACG